MGAELIFVSERGKCAVIHRKREVVLVTAALGPPALLGVHLDDRHLQGTVKLETAVLTRRRIPEDINLHSHRHMNLKSH